MRAQTSFAGTAERMEAMRWSLGNLPATGRLT